VAAVTATEQRTIEYAQERLEEWAAWIRSLRGVRLGYSPHASFVHDRVDNDRDDIAMGEEANERAEEVERIMCKLLKLRPSLHVALVQWYLLDRPQSIAAQVCKCSVTVYHDRRRMGEMFVAGALAGS